VRDLEALGLLVKIEPHKLSVGTCQRSGTVVEPMLSPQWYVRAKPLADVASQAVRDGRTNILPEMWEKTWFHWMDNIQDWCISRQLWWGHQIPAWYCQDCREITVSRTDPTACGKCGSAQLQRDPDVLDTWFSSALWPFSTLGWPDETPDLRTFYPTTVMETGFDILFFWVARMMMMGLHFMGDVPFRTVFLHAMVRDEHGQKMSKTKGNVIDPLDVTRDYGADSLRYTLAALSGQGRDIKLGLKVVETNRNFINKIWNACRFALMNLEGFDADAAPPSKLERADRWILSRLDRAVEQVQTALDRFALNEATQAMYQFFWSELCDWYIELIKPRLYGEDAEAKRAAQWTLVQALDTALRLLHPFIPFATEEIWQKLPLGADRSEVLMTAEFPRPGAFARDDEVEADMAALMGVITAIRNVRGELGIPAGQPVPAVLRTPDEGSRALLEEQRILVERLARTTTLEIRAGGDRPRGAAMQLVGAIEVHVPLVGLIDLQEELGRLDKAIAKATKDLEIVHRKLGNPEFLQNAPAAVVQKERDKQVELDGALAKLNQSRERIAALSQQG
jgi:valyl-tRNA synthetase